MRVAVCKKFWSSRVLVHRRACVYQARKCLGLGRRGKGGDMTNSIGANEAPESRLTVTAVLRAAPDEMAELNRYAIVSYSDRAASSHMSSNSSMISASTCAMSYLESRTISSISAIIRAASFRRCGVRSAEGTDDRVRSAVSRRTVRCTGSDKAK